MSINVGDKLPSVNLKQVTAEGMKDINTGDFFAGKKVVLFAVPGAFTPTCSKTHLPGYVHQADELKKKGVDEIACLSVNDAFVMDAWAEQQGAKGKVTMLADGSAELTKALGLVLDLTDKGLGIRSRRFSLVAEDGVVKSLNIEEGAGVTVSGAEACLTGL